MDCEENPLPQVAATSSFCLKSHQNQHWGSILMWRTGWVVQVMIFDDEPPALPMMRWSDSTIPSSKYHTSHLPLRGPTISHGIPRCSLWCRMLMVGWPAATPAPGTNQVITKWPRLITMHAPHNTSHHHNISSPPHKLRHSMPMYTQHSPQGFLPHETLS